MKSIGIYRGPRRKCKHCGERATVLINGEAVCYVHYNAFIKEARK